MLMHGSNNPDPSGHAPGNYPSGGPTPQVLDVWRAGAPSIDFIAPDLYTVDVFRYTCDQYTLSGNPLFLPETIESSVRAFFAYGKYSAMGYCPFGVDGREEGPDYLDMSDYRDTYGTIRQMAPIILEYQGTENISGLLADKQTIVDSVIIGGYKITGSVFEPEFDWTTLGVPAGIVASEPALGPIGGALIICTGQGEYYIAGKNMMVNFNNADPESELNVGFLTLEDGEFVDGKWIKGRTLIGDESGVIFKPDKSKIYKIMLFQY